MAEAPGHLLGQIIGNVLEAALKPILQTLAEKHSLYLDSHGPRPAIRKGSTLTWSDALGNAHDLDFVLERGGTADRLGNPAAFIEAAWRRYTKHSKAKAQEIQAAVLPVLSKWADVKPTPAAILAGEWTRPSLQQLRSSGFVVLHLDFMKTITVFAGAGMQIVGQRDGTPDEFWRKQVQVYSALSAAGKERLADSLRASHRSEFQQFVAELEMRIIRTINRVAVLPLHGSATEYGNVTAAIAAVRAYPGSSGQHPFIRFEIHIRYTNGDEIEASFASHSDAIDFLLTFA